MAVLICGGAGYIGSHVNKLLSRRGYETIIFDNLVYGHRESVKWGTFVQGDLKNVQEIKAVFEQYHIDAVMHFAAYAYVGESVIDPEKYYFNNIANTLNLLHVMKEHGCKKIIFSSTCATYGDPKKVPVTEDMPQNPINPYGYTKLAVEQILRDYRKAYGMEYIVLRYFNAAGADPDGEIGESHIPETHIIPLVLEAALGKRQDIKVFGADYPTADGSCVRDYIHVADLAEAHLLALRHLENGGTSDCFNLGNEKGTSVLEIVEVAKHVTGKEFAVMLAARRMGDPAMLVGASEKAKQVLGWKPQYGDIETIIKHAWAWHKNPQW